VLGVGGRDGFEGNVSGVRGMGRMRRGGVVCVACVVVSVLVAVPVGAQDDSVPGGAAVPSSEVPSPRQDLPLAPTGASGALALPGVSHGPAEKGYIGHVHTLRGLDSGFSMAYHPDLKLVFTISAAGDIMAFDHDGSVIRSLPLPLRWPKGVRIYDDRLFAFGLEGVVEVDPVTLAVLESYPLPGEAGAFAPFPELTLFIDGVDYVRNDRVTGTQERAPRPFRYSSAHAVGTVGDRFVLGNSIPAVLVDSSGFPPVPIETFEDEWIYQVLSDGSFLTRTETDVVHRSGGDGGVLSRTAVGLPQRPLFAYAHEAGIIAMTDQRETDLSLYEAGGAEVGSTPSSPIPLGLAISGDAQRVFLHDSDGIWIADPAPVLTSTDQQLWRPEWYDTVRLRGVSLAGATAVTINGCLSRSKRCRMPSPGPSNYSSTYAR